MGLTAGTQRSQGWDPGQLNSSFFACLFVWPCWVLVAAGEIFGVSFAEAEGKQQSSEDSQPPGMILEEINSKLNDLQASLTPFSNRLNNLVT